jgi:hypothetical protein
MPRKSTERVIREADAAARLLEEGLVQIKAQDTRVAEHRAHVAKVDAHNKISAVR